MRAFGVWSLVAACAGDPPVGGGLVDTGWFAPEPTCGAVVVASEPEAGEDAWSWRRPLRFSLSEAVAPTVTLFDDLGQTYPITVTSLDEGVYEVVWEGGLRPDRDHVLRIETCAEVREIGFRTSRFGLPLEGGAASLLGRTWQLLLDDPGALWLEPSGFGQLLGGFFDTPILVSAHFVDDRRLDLLGGQGFFARGATWQNPDYPTWNFPSAPFDEAPWFDVRADRADLQLSGIVLPITDFILSGTFAADGVMLGGVRLSGLGDTRYAGAAINQPDNPDAFCALGRGLNVPCVPCPDGQPYCLAVDVRELSGAEVPDLSLRPILP